MSDRICSGPLDRWTDFQNLNDPATGTTLRRWGTCGPTMDASMLSSAMGRAVTLQETYTWMRSHGWSDANGWHAWCDESGASTISGNIACAKGVSGNNGIVVEGGWYGVGGWDWRGFIIRHAGRHPMGVETSVGQVLIDMITGAGENATNLQYHYFSALAYHPGGIVTFGPYAGRDLPEGAFCADGASFAWGNSNANGFNAGNHLQFYAFDGPNGLAAAALCAAYAISGGTAMLDISATSGQFTQNTDGSWQHGSLIIHGGMLNYYRTVLGQGVDYGWSDLGLPLTDEIAVGSPKVGTTRQPTIQVFERKAILYDPDRVIDNPPGAVGDCYAAHMNRPEVLKVIAPAPAAPSVNFGSPIVTDTSDHVTVTLPYSVK